MTLCYFDLETGGTEPKHPTIQLAAIAVRDGVEVASFEQKISFSVEDCDPQALAMNHYSPEAWTDAVPGLVAAMRFSAWLRPFCEVQKVSRAGNPYQVARLAGYNAVAFDLPRLRTLFGSSFLPCEFLVRDILQRALFYFDEMGEPPENFKLVTVAEWLGISVNGAHDALFDVRLCAAVHRAMLGER